MILLPELLFRQLQQSWFKRPSKPFPGCPQSLVTPLCLLLMITSWCCEAQLVLRGPAGAVEGEDQVPPIPNTYLSTTTPASSPSPQSPSSPPPKTPSSPSPITPSSPSPITPSSPSPPSYPSPQTHQLVLRGPAGAAEGEDQAPPLPNTHLPTTTPISSPSLPSPSSPPPKTPSSPSSITSSSPSPITPSSPSPPSSHSPPSSPAPLRYPAPSSSPSSPSSPAPSQPTPSSHSPTTHGSASPPSCPSQPTSPVSSLEDSPQLNKHGQAGTPRFASDDLRERMKKSKKKSKPEPKGQKEETRSASQLVEDMTRECRLDGSGTFPFKPPTFPSLPY